MTTSHSDHSHSHDTHSDPHNGHASQPKSFEVRVLRQNAPGESSYWQRFQVPYETDMNVISVLQKIAAMAKTIDGEKTQPVAWDCNCLEEVCGACTMVINGRVRQACSALVDRLLEDNPQEIELRPMSKFPVVRDLFVDRSQRSCSRRRAGHSNSKRNLADCRLRPFATVRARELAAKAANQWF